MVNRLAELRKKNGLSQAKFSKLFNVAQNTISQWEQEKRDIDLSTLIRIAEYFNVTIDYILCRSDSPEPDISNDDTTIKESDIPQEFLSELKKADSNTIQEIWQFLNYLNLKKEGILDNEVAKK